MLNRKKGFSTSEILTALGIIGILCVTMLSLNTFSDNEYKVAAVKLQQVDNAMKSWGKAVTSSNETGLGAEGVITSQAALNTSISNYFNSSDKGKIQGKEVNDGEVVYPTALSGEVSLKDGNEIKLDNGVTLNVKYKNIYSDDYKSAATSDADQTYKDDYSDIIAIVTANVEVKGKDKPLTEEYVLTSTGVKSLASLYEGWTKTELYTVEGNAETGTPTKVYACNDAECTCRNANKCEDVTSSCPSGDCNYAYTKAAEKYACPGADQNGSITITYTAAGLYAPQRNTVNTCCTNPRVAQEPYSDTPICVCKEDKTTLNKGYVFSAASTSCQTPCLKGSYLAKNGQCTLCPSGSYCEKDGTQPVLCPAGYFCPENPTDDYKGKGITVTENNFALSKYHQTDKDAELGEKGILVCQDNDNDNKKFVCNDYFIEDTTKSNIMSNDISNSNLELLIPKTQNIKSNALDSSAIEVGGLINKVICPIGYYCPGPTNCQKENNCEKTDKKVDLVTPIKCPEGSYCPDEGMTAPILCPAGTYNATKGAASKDACKPCTANHYCPNPGTVEPKKCLEGTWSAEGATVCQGCPAGSKLEGGKCVLCPKGTYQDQAGQTACEACPANSSTAKEGAISLSQCKCNAGYGTDANGTNFSKDTNGKVVGECKLAAIGTYTPALDNRIYSCPTNSSTATTGSSAISDCKCNAGYALGEGNVNSCSLDFSKDSNGKVVGECKLTAIGEYSPALNNCKTSCPANSSTKTTGSSSLNQCQCNGGYASYNRFGECYGLDLGYVTVMRNGQPYFVNPQTNKLAKVSRDSVGGNCIMHDTPDEWDGSNAIVATSCAQVQKGQYSPTLDNKTHACECGTYQDKAGQAACIDVPAGKYPSRISVTNKIDYVVSAATDASNCIAGHMCEGKCHNPIQCEAGTFTTINGAYTTNNRTKVVTGTVYNATTCTLCPEGTYQPNAGQSACSPCPKGQYSTNTPGRTSCQLCPAGTYSNQIGLITADECTICPEGRYSTATGATNINTCQNCPKGTYVIAGSYSHNNLPYSDEVCKACPVGTYSTKVGTQTVDTVGDGAGVCQFCPLGQRYKDATSCELCPRNTYGNRSASMAPDALTDKYNKANYPYCEPCPFGTAFTGTGATRVTQCVACRAGQQTNEDGTCSDCEAGYYSEVSPDDPNVKICVPCPAGTSTNGISGSTSIAACIPCGQDTYAPTEGSATCSACDSQTYADAKITTINYRGQSVRVGNTACTNCASYDESVYLITQGHNHAVTLDALLKHFICVPNQNITADQRKLANGEGRQNLYIITNQGRLIDYIDTTNGVVNPVKDSGGSFGTGKLSKLEFKYSPVAPKNWIGNNSCNAHGSSVAGGTLYTHRTQCTYPVNYVFKVQSPLVFDILGNGLTFTDVASGVYFNITGNGEERTAWTTVMKEFDDAFLCVAKNPNSDNILDIQYGTGVNVNKPFVDDNGVHNVWITSGKQLFGDQYGEKTGFDELMKYDKNGDGFIDKNDDIYTNLLLWSDMNKNGRVDYYKYEEQLRCAFLWWFCETKTVQVATTPEKCEGLAASECFTNELATLESMGITSIATSYSTEFNEDGVTIKTDEHGNVIGYVGEFVMNVWDSVTNTTQEVIRKIVDVFFKTANS